MLTADDQAEVKQLIADALWAFRLADPIVEVTARAMEVLGSREKALRWLKAPIRSLGDQAPLSLLNSEIGIDRVKDVLGQIEHGVW